MFRTALGYLEPYVGAVDDVRIDTIDLVAHHQCILRVGVGAEVLQRHTAFYLLKTDNLKTRLRKSATASAVVA